MKPYQTCTLNKQKLRLAKKQQRFNKIFLIMKIYIKYLLCEPIEEIEQKLFFEYCQYNIYEKNNKTSFVFEQQQNFISELPEQYFQEHNSCMGDLVLKFPNPDFMEPQAIGYTEAMEFLQQSVGIRCEIGCYKKKLDYAILHVAFQFAFFQLKDSWQNDRGEEQKKQQSVVQTHLLERALQLLFKGQDKLEFNEINDDFISAIKKKMLNRLCGENYTDYFLINNNQNQQKCRKKKLLTNGKFTKQTPNGIEKSAHKVRDFHTLARNIILLRLAQQGFKIRTFIAQDYKTIYSVLQPVEQNISIVAQETKMRKFLNLEFTDLLSLEPVDLNYRPLRLNNRLWRNDIERNQSLNFQYLKPKIIKLLQKINFKKMAKELHIQNLNDQMFDYGQRDIIGDEEGPSDELWEAYYEYLVYLDSKVQEARDKFYFKLDFAVLMNPPRHKKKTNKDQQEPTKKHQFHNKNSLEEAKLDQLQYMPTERSAQKIQNFKSYLKRKQLAEKKTKYQKIQPENHFIISDTYFKNFDEILLNCLTNFVKNILKFQQENLKTSQDYLKLITKFWKNNEDCHDLFFEYSQKETTDFLISNTISSIINFLSQESQNVDEIRNPYLENFEQYLLDDLLLLSMNEEEKIWHEQIKKENEQFQNIKNNQNYHKKDLCTKYLKENKRWQLGHEYGSAMREGIQIINNVKGDLLKCIWDVSFKEQKNIALSSEYFLPTNRLSFKNQKKISTIWQQYQISEQGQVSVFSHIERVKLAYQLVQQALNVPFLITHQISIFCLNDKYELFGLSNQEILKADSNSTKQETCQNYNPNKLPKVDLTSESYFVKKKLCNLEQIWKMRLGEIWYVPSVEVRDYYGEKIALYFTFLSHYTKSLLIPGIAGLICSIIQSITPPKVAIVLGMIFGIANSQFLSILLGSWKLKEKQVVVQFAQNFKQEKQKKEQRPSFKGEYRRDPCNDEANTLYYPITKIFAKMILSGIILGFAWSIYIGCLIGLFYMTKFFYEYDIFTGLEKLEFLKLEVSIPCSINVFILNFFDYVYESLSEHMTDQENHETVADFEANFIIKKFTLVLLSYFAPIFMIAFLNDELGIDCAYGSCIINARYYFTSLFIILFIFNIKEVLQPIIHKLLGKKQEEPNFNDEFGQVNAFIEQEAQKESYFQSVDRYGTVDDYMEIIVQSGLLGLFAPLFPASMFIGFVWNALEMQTDKIKLLKYFQRPVPLDEQSIGIWSLLLEFLANFSLIFNTGVVFLMGKLHPDRQGPTEPFIKDITLFLIIILLAFLLRFIIEGLIPEATYEFISIMKRQAYLLRSTLENFKNKANNKKKQKQERINFSRYVIFKPYGTIIKDVQKFNIDIKEEIEFDDLQLQIELEEDKSKKNREKQTMAVQDIPILNIGKKKKQILRKNIGFFEFQVKKCESPILQKEQLQKIKKLKILLNFFEQNYTLKWCEQRMLYRRVHQKRSKILYQNLNFRKLKVFLQSYHKLFEYFKIQAQQKENYDAIEDNAEKEQQGARINHFAKRKATQILRKTVVLKSGKGIWFGQFRKQVLICKAKETISSFLQIENKLNKLNLKSKSIPISMIKKTDKILMKQREQIFEEISSLDIYKSSSLEVINFLTNSSKSFATRQNKKTQLVKKIEQLYDLETRKIQLIQSQLYHQEIPNHLSLAQEQLKFIFIQIQKSYLRNTELSLIKLIEKQNQREVWLIKQSYELKILELLDIDVSDSCGYFDEMILQEFSLFDQFYYSSSKGVIGRIFESKQQLLNGWTISDTVKFRKALELYYTEDQLLQFLFNLLNSFENKKKRLTLHPKQIFGYQYKNQVGYSFFWTQSLSKNINSSQNIFQPQDSSNNCLSEMIYNAGMIIGYMMTLGDIEQNENYLELNEASLMNNYPIILTIIQEMLLQGKQQQSYHHIKSLCENECKNKEQFLEDVELSQILITESQNILIQQQNIKFQGQIEFMNEIEVQKLHEVLSSKLFKLDCLNKLKLLKQFKIEINECQDIMSNCFGKSNCISYLQKSIQLFCDFPNYQKLLIDFLSIEFYKKLYIFFENLDFEGLCNHSFASNFDEIFSFIEKIQQYYSEEIEEEYDQQKKVKLRKRLSIHSKNYQQLNIKISKLRCKFLFLYSYGEMFKQNYGIARKTMKKSLLMCKNNLRNLIVSLNIGILEQSQLQQIEYLNNIDCFEIEYFKSIKQNLLIKLYLESEQYNEALKQCVIVLPEEQQCIFQQILYQETLTLHSQIQWCLNNYQNNYFYFNFWLQKLKDNSISQVQVVMISLHNLEGCINLLYYNYDFSLVEHYFKILNQFSENNLFLVNYLLFKLQQIVYSQQGSINFNSISKSFVNSNEVLKNYLEKAYILMPKYHIGEYNYVDNLYFEIESNLQINQDYEQLYLEEQGSGKKINEIFFHRAFIIGKYYFINKQFSIAKRILSLAQCKIESIVDAWKIKNNIMMKIQPEVKFNLFDLSWKNYFKSFLFDLNVQNGQLACQIVFKLIKYQIQVCDNNCNLEFEQFTILFVKLLLEEYKDENDDVIKKNYEIKYLILNLLNQKLSDLSHSLLTQMFKLDDRILQKFMFNQKDLSIESDKIQVQNLKQHIKGLFNIRMILLEESGDPISVLKSFDVQYATILYDKRFSSYIYEIFSEQQQHKGAGQLIAGCKLAINKAFFFILNSELEFQKIRNKSLEGCIEIVKRIAKKQKIKITEFPRNKIIWDEFALKIIEQGDSEHQEEFQTYKLIYYQCEWKLLEYYAIVGLYREAHHKFQSLFNHYQKLFSANDESQEDIKNYFEYSFGNYFKYTGQIELACNFFDRSVKRDRGFKVFYDNKNLNIPFSYVEGNFTDKFTNDDLTKDLLDQFNHEFTFASRLVINRCQTRIYVDEIDYYKLFKSIIRIIEKIKKTMGRQSILYADALLVYAEYILVNKEKNWFQQFKQSFVGQYFYTRKESEYFEPFIIKSKLQYKFFSPEEIEQKLNENLMTLWIEDLLDQCYNFYKEYFNSIEVYEHYSMVYCDILQFRLALSQGRLYQAQQMLDRSLSCLKKLCESLQHLYAILIFEGYALLCENLNKIQEENISLILECPPTSRFSSFSQEDRYKIITQIYLRNNQICQFFDDFRKNGFEEFLFLKLQRFIDQNVPRRQSLKLQKLRRQTTLELKDTIQIKEKAKIQAQLNKNQILDENLKIGVLGYYRKAYRISKSIFKEQNSLSKRIETRYIELCKLEEKENQIQ